MSPRNRIGKILILVVFALALSSTGLAQGLQEQPTDFKDQTKMPQEEKKNIVMDFYQSHISAVDGDRCPMTPSCSEYAARAVEKHGVIMGWIMACDRLQRCGRDEVRLAPHIRIKGRIYVSDPVKANDFWWFTEDGGSEKAGQ